jgi:hypothetical protein
LLIGGAAGVARAGSSELAPATPVFVVCSGADFFVVAAAAISGWAGVSALARFADFVVTAASLSGFAGTSPPPALRTCSSIRR